jgi:hypothetical protein
VAEMTTKLGSSFAWDVEPSDRESVARNFVV